MHAVNVLELGSDPETSKAEKFHLSCGSYTVFSDKSIEDAYSNVQRFLVQDGQSVVVVHVDQVVDHSSSHAVILTLVLDERILELVLLAGQSFMAKKQVFDWKFVFFGEILLVQIVVLP